MSRRSSRSSRPSNRYRTSRRQREAAALNARERLALQVATGERTAAIAVEPRETVTVASSAPAIAAPALAHGAPALACTVALAIAAARFRRAFRRRQP